MPGSDELVALYDQAGSVARSATRGRVRAEALWHAAGVVLVRSGDGKAVYVHLRTPVKDVFPSTWDCWAGGDVSPRARPPPSAPAASSPKNSASTEREPDPLFTKVYDHGTRPLPQLRLRGPLGRPHPPPGRRDRRGPLARPGANCAPGWTTRPRKSPSSPTAAKASRSGSAATAEQRASPHLGEAGASPRPTALAPVLADDGQRRNQPHPSPAAPCRSCPRTTPAAAQRRAARERSTCPRSPQRPRRPRPSDRGTR